MIVYLVATLPWMVGTLAIGPYNEQALKWRKISAFAFFVTLIPMIYFFIQHKVHHVAGGKEFFFLLRVDNFCGIYKLNLVIYFY
jgi:hypothetical protein